MQNKNTKYVQNTVLHGNLLLPFGTTKKWDISRIKLQYASASGLHFTSDVPFVHINRRDQRPLYLTGATEVFGDAALFHQIANADREQSALNRIRQKIKQYMADATEHEHKFLNLYFDYMQRTSKYRNCYDDEGNKIDLVQSWSLMLLPIPQVQIYCEDPLEKEFGTAEPKNNFRLDFVFWTGKKLVAIEVDGYEPKGYAHDVRRDRLLRRAGVDLIHVLNSEIDEFGDRVIRNLLPSEIVHPTKHWAKNHFSNIYTFESEYDPLDDEIPF